MKLLIIDAIYDWTPVYSQHFELAGLYKRSFVSDTAFSDRYCSIGYSPAKNKLFIDGNGRVDSIKITITQSGNDRVYAPFHGRQNSPSGDLYGEYTDTEFAALNKDHVPGSLNMVAINNLLNDPAVKTGFIELVSQKNYALGAATIGCAKHLRAYLVVDDDVTITGSSYRQYSTNITKKASDGSDQQLVNIYESIESCKVSESNVDPKAGDFSTFLEGVRCMKTAMEATS